MSEPIDTFRISWIRWNKIGKQNIVNSLMDARKFAKGILLDVGCGSKPYEKIFSDNVKYYVGVDLPRSMYRKKNNRLYYYLINDDLKVNGNRVDIFANALSLPIKSSSIDTILLTEVIEHIPEPTKLVRELARVLKKGGVLIITTPQVWPLHEEPNDYYRFTKYGLKYLLETNGFKIISFSQRGRFFAMIGQMINDYIVNTLIEKHWFLFFIYPLCILVSFVFYYLDKIFPDYRHTLGHMIVAIKETN
ncbi:MAG: class I SAM-dependent methyltransferase [Archaeoglobus sp.]|nr:class I SAM-dependent methyltransferase [Archaeoglobus sp.]